MEKLFYIPLNKYDNVIEHFDGTITIPPHQKKRYLFCSLFNDDLYILNSLNGNIYQYYLHEQSIVLIFPNLSGKLKKHIGLYVNHNEIVTFDPEPSCFLFFNRQSGVLQRSLKIEKSYQVNNFTLYDNIIYFTCSNTFKIYKIIQDSIEPLFNFTGIPDTSIYIDNQKIFITNSEENIVRAYSFNGQILFEAITPFIDPIGQVIIDNQHFILYSGLVNEVGYENRCWQEQKPFFHELKIKLADTLDYTITLSNGVEVEFFYEEHFSESLPDEYLPITLFIALPQNTLNQKVVNLSHLGLPFEIIEKNNHKYASYRIQNSNTKALGYKAILHLFGIKYTPKKQENIILKKGCLFTEKEKEELDIYRDFFKQFILQDFNLCDIEKIKHLRNLIFERLEYKKNIYARNFEEVFEDGYGTCGDYTSLMLNLFTQNNFLCQSVGGYKIPRFYHSLQGIYSIYYNHAWVDVFDEKGNSLPLESSSDDKEYNNRFCEAQFLGLDWSHIKLYHGKAFPHLIHFSDKNLHPFDYLKKSSVFVKILRELDPTKQHFQI